MAKTAAELMAKLAKNKDYQARMAKKREQFAELERIYTLDEEPLVADLNDVGFSVGAVWDFVNSDNYYLDAVPVLLKHLKIKHHPKTISGIARSLAIKSLTGNEELWSTLIELYRKTPSNVNIEVAAERGSQESIAVALAILATESRVAELENIIKEHPNGDGMLLLKDAVKCFKS